MATARPPPRRRAFTAFAGVHVGVLLAALLFASRAFADIRDGLDPRRAAFFTQASLAETLYLVAGTTLLFYVPAGAILTSCPLGAYRRCSARALRAASLACTAALSAWALAKMLWGAANDNVFWLFHVTMFFLVCGQHAALMRLASHTPAWAAAAATTQLGWGTGQAEAKAEEEGEAAAAAATSTDTSPSRCCCRRPATPPLSAKAAASKATLLRLLSLSRPDWAWLLTGFSGLALAALGQTYMPSLTGSAIDAVALDHDADAFRRNLLLLAAVSLGTAAFTGVRGWAFTMALARLRVRLRDRLFRSVMAQELAFFETTSTGELTSRLTADTTAVGDQLSLNVNVFLRSLIQAVGSLVFMATLSLRLTLLAFAIIPPTMLVSTVYGNYVQRLSTQSQDRLAAANKVSDAAFAAAATVRAHGAEQREADTHAALLAGYFDANARQAAAYGYYAGITTALPALATATILYVGSRLVQAGELTGGQLISFILYAGTVSSSFASLADIFSGLMSAVGAAQKIFELLDRAPKQRQDGARAAGGVSSAAEGQSDGGSGGVQVAATGAGAAAAATVAAAAAASPPRRPASALATVRTPSGLLQVCTLPDSDDEDGEGVAHTAPRASPAPLRCPRPPVFGRIDLQGVCFSYPSRPEKRVLADFSLTLYPGQTVALVGASGGGKSSVVKLIQRLYDPQAGAILLDGVPVHEYDHVSFHRAVAAVNQEPVLFGRTIHENVSYGADDDEEGLFGGSGLGAAPAYTSYRPSTGGGGAAAAGPGWSSRVDAIDNTGAIIKASKLQRGWAAAYAAARREALEALNAERRAALLARVGASAGARSGGGSGRRDDGNDVAPDDSLSVPLLAVGEGGRDEGRAGANSSTLLRRPPPALALALLAPGARWAPGASAAASLAKPKPKHTRREEDGGSGSSSTGAQLEDLKAQEAAARRERRVKAWIRAHAERFPLVVRQLVGGPDPGGVEGASSSSRLPPAEVAAFWEAWYGAPPEGGEQDTEEGDEALWAADTFDPESSTLPPPPPSLSLARRITSACKLANAHDFISALPDGYATPLAERGGALSGGQKQRVAIARSVLRDPAVLLLDESSSALDATNEHLVTQALNTAMAGRTVLVIAHRLSTIRHADRICVVAGGRIIEEGRHEELLARVPASEYARLVARQVEAAGGGGHGEL